VEIGSREGPVAGPLIGHLASAVPRCPHGWASDQISFTPLAFVSPGVASRAKIVERHPLVRVLTKSKEVFEVGNIAGHDQVKRSWGTLERSVWPIFSATIVTAIRCCEMRVASHKALKAYVLRIAVSNSRWIFYRFWLQIRYPVSKHRVGELAGIWLVSFGSPMSRALARRFGRLENRPTRDGTSSGSGGRGS
jgi:hypothetical protein